MGQIDQFLPVHEQQQFDSGAVRGCTSGKQAPSTKADAVSDEIESSSLLTAREAAELLRVSPQTIYRLVRTRSIPGAFKVMGRWRFSLEQLNQWMKTAEFGATLATERKKV